MWVYRTLCVNVKNVIKDSNSFRVLYLCALFSLKKKDLANKQNKKEQYQELNKVEEDIDVIEGF